MPRNHDIVTVGDLYYCMDTKEGQPDAGAYGVKLHPRDRKMIFLPKSLTELAFPTNSGTICEVQIPEWLAIEKGLV